MANIIKIHHGTASAVYDDRWFPLLEAMGLPTIRRASEVEYDHIARAWVATLADTGAEIARGQNRADVINHEVTYLEANSL